MPRNIKKPTYQMIVHIIFALHAHGFLVGQYVELLISGSMLQKHAVSVKVNKT